MFYENHAKEHKPYSRFKEEPNVNSVHEGSSSEDDTEVCIAEWVDTAKDNPLACLFLKTSPGKREEIKFTFDESKCYKLFDVLLQITVIWLSEGHIIPPPGQLAKGKYCE
jgi:hypothetical protein